MLQAVLELGWLFRVKLKSGGLGLCITVSASHWLATGCTLQDVSLGEQLPVAKDNSLDNVVSQFQVENEAISCES